MKLDIKGTALLERTINSKAKIVVHRGGSSSSKTYSLAQYMVIQALSQKGIVISVFRQALPSIKKSVFRDFERILEQAGLMSQIKIWRTDLRIEFSKTGSIIEFTPAGEPDRLRGPRREIAWLNEATEISFEAFRQIALRTRQQVFIDFNPSDPEFWGNTKLEKERAKAVGDVEVIVSNYLSNPYLTDLEVQEIESLKPVFDGEIQISGDDSFFRVFGLGEYGSFSGRIFNNFQVIDLAPDIELFHIGLDFGYQNDPTAVIEVARDDNKLYLHERTYEKGLSNNDLAGILSQYNRRSVYCDSAEPKSIAELRVLGINAKPALKGRDSILNGIQLMTQFEIYITSSSLNLIKEFQRYCWASDQNGELTNKPLDRYNHAIDAIRYVLSKTALKRKIEIHCDKDQVQNTRD